jgi:hypothetical protein
VKRSATTAYAHPFGPSFLYNSVLDSFVNSVYNSHAPPAHATSPWKFTPDTSSRMPA